MHVPALNIIVPWNLKSVVNILTYSHGTSNSINIWGDFILQAKFMVVKANDSALRGNFLQLYEKWLKSGEL